MIRLFTLNISEEILNNFKGFEIHSYSDNFSTSVAEVYEDDNLICKMFNPDYDRINSCILGLRRREESNGI